MGAGLLFFNFTLLSQLHGSDFARAIYYLLCNPYIQVMFEVLSKIYYFKPFPIYIYTNIYTYMGTSLIIPIIPPLKK